ncbi:MAG TPA: APC family permease [Amycolatopsis sp.]|uniref:APC family permease n=1 Tax=Amycolatopsis sp. TaxID=37632 RepID=UPI002B458F61|nr:APC family permease [Amycolatopsis sp.]HKS44179.1 APC family permease [Amycolatopsis sp.]
MVHGVVDAKRKIGVREATAIGVGGVVGAGIFVLSGTASALAGPAVIVAFLLAFLASLSLAMCFGELSSMHKESGGQYAYAKAHLPPIMATIVGWANMGAWIFGASFVGTGFGEHLHLIIPAIPPAAGASVLTAVIVVMNLFGLRMSGRVQFVVMLLEVAFLSVFIVIGGGSAQASNFSPFVTHGWFGILAAAVVGFIALLGWDAVVVAAEEIHEPQRTIPKSIFASLAIVFVLYIGLLVVVNGVLSPGQLEGTATPVADAAAVLLGPAGRTAVNVIIVVALTATVNSFVIVISRSAFVLARDNRMPRVVARRSARGVPWVAIVLAGGSQICVTMLADLRFAVSATGFLYMITSVAAIVALFVARRRGAQGTFRVPLYPLTPAVALVLCSLFVIGTGVTGVLTGTAWLVAGVFCAAVVQRRTHVTAAPEELGPVPR